jgi:hypothetical protein
MVITKYARNDICSRGTDNSFLAGRTAYTRGQKPKQHLEKRSTKCCNMGNNAFK